MITITTSSIDLNRSFVNEISQVLLYIFYIVFHRRDVLHSQIQSPAGPHRGRPIPDLKPYLRRCGVLDYRAVRRIPQCFGGVDIVKDLNAGGIPDIAAPLHKIAEILQHLPIVIIGKFKAVSIQAEYGVAVKALPDKSRRPLHKVGIIVMTGGGEKQRVHGKL